MPDEALFSVEAIREIESRFARPPEDGSVLMRRAGLAAWQAVLEHWPQSQRILVVCGPGNNGADGYLLAAHALASGREVRVIRLATHPPRSELAQLACDEYGVRDGLVDVFSGRLPAADLVVDALFGIGLSRAPDAEAASLIEAINTQTSPVLSLDVPSGVDADRGEVPGVAVRAARTVEFIAPKAGLRTGAALDHVGARSVARLDLLPTLFSELEPSAISLAPTALVHWLRPRPRNSHKGCFGRMLCVGGDHQHGGAILLAAQAALRTGAGLLKVVTHPDHRAPLLARLPEAMAIDDDDDDAWGWAEVVAIGPGLGQGDWGRRLLGRAMAAGRPLLLDADALNLLPGQADLVPAGSVLTPHPGEAARLLGVDVPAVQRDRYAAAKNLSEAFQAVVVLKGAGTVVAAPGQCPRVVDAGNPGMAVGGMGDVLSGVIAALMAQGQGAFDAACCGALLHAAAGDRAAAEGGERGLLPTDLMRWLRRLANPESRS